MSMSAYVTFSYHRLSKYYFMKCLLSTNTRIEMDGIQQIFSSHIVQVKFTDIAYKHHFTKHTNHHKMPFTWFNRPTPPSQPHTAKHAAEYRGGPININTINPTTKCCFMSLTLRS